MITAIYARKSTEQNGVSDEAKSVTRRLTVPANAYEGRLTFTGGPGRYTIDGQTDPAATIEDTPRSVRIFG
jgi:hypothetical protein